MIYLYSTNDRPGAKIIRWGGDDKCSHFAKYYPHNKMVVESRLDTGVREIPISEWKEENRIVYAQNVALPVADEVLYHEDKQIIGKEYDKKAVLFHAFTTILKKMFRWVPFVENKWGDKDHYYCLEIVMTHEHELEESGMEMDYDMENMYPEEFHDIAGQYLFITDIYEDII